MTPETIVLWKSALKQFQAWEVRAAMTEFILTAKREDARGVVLGDLTGIIFKAKYDRARKAEQGAVIDKMAQWGKQQKLDIESDPEGFEQARQAFLNKLKEIAARKSMPAVAADSIDATDEKA